MDWLNTIWTKLERLLTERTEYVQTSPKAGYLVVIFALLIWLLGLIFDWKWTYARPGSWGGNFWLDLLGPSGLRFWLGVFIVLAILLAAYLFFKT